MSVKPMRRASPPKDIVGLEELPAVKMRMAPAHDTTMITRVVVAHLFGGTGTRGIIPSNYALENDYTGLLSTKMTV